MFRDEVNFGMFAKLFGTDNVACEMLQNGVINNSFDAYCSNTDKVLCSYILKKNKKSRMNNLKAMFELEQELSKYKVNHAFFKGTVMYHDVYIETQYDRMEGDIDLLVEAEELCTVLKVIGELGYYHKHTNASVTPKNMFSYYIEEASHLDKFYSNDDTIILEIHTFPISISLIDSQLETEQLTKMYLMNNIRYISFSDFKAPTLGITETLFVLLDHFSRHIIFDIYTCAEKGNVAIGFAFKTLFDCQCVIKKYNNVIDWTVITDLCHKFHNENNIIYSLNSLIKIWPELSQSIFKDKITVASQEKFLYQKIAKRLLKEDIFVLYQNNKRFNNYPRKIYWDITCKPLLQPQKIQDENNPCLFLDLYCLYDNLFTPFRKYSYAQVDILNNLKLPPSANFSIQWVGNDITIRLSYYLPPVQNTNSISIEIKFVDENRVMEDNYINCGILEFCFTAQYSTIAVESNREIENGEIAVPFTYEYEFVDNTFQILFHINYQSEKSNKIYYNISLEHIDVWRRSFIKRLSLWNNGVESNKTNMNTLMHQDIDQADINQL